MPSVINTNLASMFAQNALSGAQKNLSTSVQRLSSGLRINSAADDAAGLSVAQNMQSQINGINMAARNVGDATNLLTTADSSLSTIQDMLLRMKSLVVEGRNDSLSFAQKANVNTELDEIRQEINNVATRTTFNGNNLLANTGTLAIPNLVVGAGAGTGSVISNVTLTGTKPQQYTFSAPTTTSLRITGADGISQTKTIAATTVGGTATYDFDTLGIKFTISSTAVTADTAVVTALAALAASTSTATGASTLTFQSGAANNDQYVYSALNVRTDTGSAEFVALATQITAITTQINAADNGLVNTAFTTLSTNIDTAINKINTQRATLGSQMNRLSYTNTNLLAQSTNMQNSRSAVIDTDFAKETASLTKGQIMQQAATAMLAQANQMPNVILSLLK
jgi:flagellin